jgi:hypothetical protein
MSRRIWVTFHELDGRVRVELLGSGDDFAELVDPDDGSVRHAGPFVMHGREWRIDNVTATEDMIRIECISTAAQVQFSPPASSSRSSIRR